VRVAHLSDLHLGHRVFPRRERGGNLRERDVAASFHLAIQELARLAPDMVLLAGDLFHHADPPSTAFLTLTRGIRRLQDLLPGVPVFAIAGECDTPMAPGDPGPVAVLDAVPGVEAAAGAPRAVHLTELSAHVLLVPHRAVVRPPFPELRPDPGARWNILLVRGHPAGEPGGRGGLRKVGTGMRRNVPGGGALVLDSEGWDYVALGGPHGMRSWGETVHCAGSLERVGADPWSEAATEKGFLLADLARGQIEFHPLPTRPVVDLAPVRVTPEDPGAGTRRLRELLEGFPGGVEGKIVRVRLQGDVLAPSDGVSPGLLAGIRRKAAHLEVQVEAPGDARASAMAPPPPVLEWEVGEGRGGHLTLGPGLWAVTATNPGDLEAVARALERVRTSPSEGARAGADAGPDSGFGAEPTDGPGGAATEARAGTSLSFLLRSADGSASVSVSGVKSGASSRASLPASKTSDPNASSAGRSPASSRGDWIEAAGDAEARALEWMRERQEADSRLLAYRERARELRERIRLLREDGASALCPTCRRPLAEAHPALLDLLEEEWEEVVQDGTWWKRRRVQLEDKPADLLALERTALRLQALMEEGARGGEGGDRAVGEAEGDAAAPDLHSRARLRRAGFLLQRATEGRVEGMRPGVEGRLLLVEAGGHVRPPTRDEEALMTLALEAVAGEVGPAEDGGGDRGPGDGDLGGNRSGPEPGGPGVHLLLAGRSGVREEEALRLLDAVASDPGPRPWLAVVPPAVAASLPHRLQGTLEVTRDEEDRLRIRPGPPGRARLELADAPGNSRAFR